jgi:hypothetical protein
MTCHIGSARRIRSRKADLSRQILVISESKFKMANDSTSDTHSVKIRGISLWLVPGTWKSVVFKLQLCLLTILPTTPVSAVPVHGNNPVMDLTTINGRLETFLNIIAAMDPAR